MTCADRHRSSRAESAGGGRSRRISHMFGFFKKAWHYVRERGWLPHVAICTAFLCFLWLAVFGEQGLYDLHKAAKLKVKFGNDIHELNNKIEQLKLQKELLNDPAYLELIIRRELGYVKQGEIVYQQIE